MRQLGIFSGRPQQGKGSVWVGADDVQDARIRTSLVAFLYALATLRNCPVLVTKDGRRGSVPWPLLSMNNKKVDYGND